ncbi:MAG: type I methionyl aminopeptidase [Anaerolineales bacterium]|jgi:methionyl aminopeptidase|nr:type I methionyl aminopeptidase [Anaerolineales bacterium]
MSWERSVVLKTKSEIEIMRQAGRINAAALAATRAALIDGVTTAELDALAAEVIRKHGAKPAFLGVMGAYPYPATITASVNEELVHGIPGKRKLRNGDIVSIDCGTIFEGFVADSAYTAGVGEISVEAQRLIEVTEQSLAIGISMLRDGNRVGDVGFAIQQFAEGEGYCLTREYTGHGVGRSMWEGPQVPNYGTKGRGMVLREGMVIAVEPMLLVGTARTKVLPDQWTVVSADGSLTAHAEHSIAITDGEPYILTVL